MLDLEGKKAVVSEVSQIIAESNAVVAAAYHGTDVAGITELRARAREQGVRIRVVKNTLARRAFEGTSFQCMSEGLKGPLLLAFSQNEQSDAAKLIKSFIDDHENTLKVTMVALPDQLLDETGLKMLASMPTREEALATLMAVMRAPISKFVRTLSAVPEKFVRTLTALKETKGD